MAVIAVGRRRTGTLFHLSVPCREVLGADRSDDRPAQHGVQMRPRSRRSVQAPAASSCTRRTELGARRHDVVIVPW